MLNISSDPYMQMSFHGVSRVVTESHINTGAGLENAVTVTTYSFYDSKDRLILQIHSFGNNEDLTK